MEASTAKAIAMLTLGLGSFISGMLPACVSDNTRQRHPLLVSVLLCFGAGVLLSTSLTHMLPEAREKYPKYSELMLCAGFLLVYLVDELVHIFYGANGNSHNSNGNNLRYGSTEQTSLLHRRSNGDDELAIRDRCCGDAGNPRMCHVSHTAPCDKSSSGILGLMFALLVHSILEGLAIGLQETSSQILLLLAAVSAHKFVVGFCLGCELCTSCAGRLCLQVVSVLIFSGGSVAGIAIGAGLDSVSVVKDSVAVPIMQELAAGTLLYVTVSEVLPRERARWHERKRTAGAAQFAAVSVGFATMFLLTTYLAVLDNSGAGGGTLAYKSMNFIKTHAPPPAPPAGVQAAALM